MCAAAACGVSAGARASPPGLAPNRDEFIPVPALGGNTDVGVEIGAAGTYVRFRDGYYPYRFRLDMFASTSFKSADGGFRFVQQYHTVRLDMPQFLSPRLRLDAQLDFFRLVDAPWFGLGNASVVQDRPTPPGAASPYVYVAEHVRARVLFRIKTDTPFDLAFSTSTRYELADPYPGSKLADDLAAHAIVGGEPSLLETVAGGFIVDTRDSEFVPTRGIFYQLGLAGTVGSAEDVRFGEASAVLSHYASLGPVFIFASRMIGSFEFGQNVPFYELQQGGIFYPRYLVGGSRGVRGVRLGRYAGAIKTVANTELRMFPFPRFHVFHWTVLAGATTFFDAGRVWSGYASRPDLDARRLGLKYGAGGGLVFQWDEANVFRIDTAYSNDEEGRTIPLSLYFETGFSF
ncbi:MAG: hypothetical protein JWP87_2210 [Labilithrix sp.]|nr:hypothetical protein [Labilithrix sp.]